MAVLETMADGDTKDSLSLLDRQYLTNVLREQAVKELPARDGFTIMTRENISAMLPPGKAIEDCEGSCLAETGRNISADYVCQARVGRFGSKLTLSAELYETAGNKLIASFNGRGADVEELLVLIESKSAEFFREVKEMNEPVYVPEASKVPEPIDGPAEVPDADTSTVILNSADSVRTEAAVAYDELDGKDASRVGESVPANVNDEPAKKGGIHWIPLSISAVVTAVGITAIVMGNKKAKEASEKTWTTEDEYRDYHQDAKDYQKTRAVGIGIAIVGAIGVGLSIVF
ncbi:hypothetical protein [uncultured Fibrobacter sp.]|uniref:hypothetical protein n=1 Tax=uncultured Fibrobacter sp. TaxID=261512 RepID=UPI0026378B7A|nr:hypothetical protein [uncultured Fibrobacter sp.]